MGENRKGTGWHPLRRQQSEVLRSAAEACGGLNACAAQLNVDPYVLSNWIAERADAPQELVKAAADLVLKKREGA